MALFMMGVTQSRLNYAVQMHSKIIIEQQQDIQALQQGKKYPPTVVSPIPNSDITDGQTNEN